MNDHEPFREIEDLLRADKPRVTPPPGLEERILDSIQRNERERKLRILPWLLVPAAAAAVAIAMLWPSQQPGQTPVAGTETVPVVEKPVEVAEVQETLSVEAPPEEVAGNTGNAGEHGLAAFFENPLARETRALKRDARRAGHFLINALPSLSVEVE